MIPVSTFMGRDPSCEPCATTSAHLGLATYVARDAHRIACRRMDRADVLVVGGGIVGLATARAVLRAHPGSLRRRGREGSVGRRAPERPQLRRDPRRRLLPARARTRPGCAPPAASSMVRVLPGARHRPRGVRQGRRRARRGRPARASPSSSGGASANGVRTEMIGPERLRELEPHVAGVAALHVLDTGIVDYARRVPRRSPTRSSTAGAPIRLGCARARRARRRAAGLVVETTGGPIEAQRVVTCAGLHADEVARAVSGPDGRRRRARRSRSAASTASSCPSRVAPRARPRLPGARPAVPVPRRAPHPRHRRPRARRAERGARVRARGLRVAAASTSRHLRETFAFPGSGGSRAHNWRFGARRDGALAEPASVRGGGAAARARDRAGRPRARAGRRARAGDRRRRRARRRLRDPHGRARACTCSTRRRRRRPRRSRSARRSRPARPRRLTELDRQIGSGSFAVGEHLERVLPRRALGRRSSAATAVRSGPSGPSTHGRLAHTPSATRIDTGISAPTSCASACTSPLDGEPDALHGRALQVADLVRRVAHVALDRREPLRREVDAALRARTRRAAACRPPRSRAGTRTSRRARRPPTRARCAGARRTRARCASVSRSVSSAVPEPITATGRSAQRRVRYSVITSSGLVTTSATRGQRARLDRGRDVVHHLDVLVQHVEPALARRRVVAGGDDEDVLVLDLVEPAPAHLDAARAAAGRA